MARRGQWLYKSERLSARGRGRSPSVGGRVDEDIVRRGLVGRRRVRGRIDDRDANHPAGQMIDARGGEGSAQGAVIVVVVRGVTEIGVPFVPFVQELAHAAEAEADGQEQGEIDQRATHGLHDFLVSILGRRLEAATDADPD